jgi:2-iminobutanoate/2-iminopropanoate deaminase
VSDPAIRPVRAEDAPAPVAGAPYSPGVVAEAAGLVFVSGQVPIDPATGALIDGDVAAQTTLALAHVGAILRAAGSGLDRVVKTTIYLTDLAGDFATMNEAYRAALGPHAPARATVGVAALPLGAAVEIEAIALA